MDSDNSDKSSKKSSIEIIKEHEKRLENNRVIGNIAHEFNNLLMGIKGNLSLIFLDMEKNDQFYGRLKDIEKYISGGEKLTEKLLEFVYDGVYEPVQDKKNIVDKSSFYRIKKEIAVGIYNKESISSSDIKLKQGLQVYNKVFSEIKTILLVDDDTIIIDVGKQLLEKMGYSVIASSSGEEAVELYKKNYSKINMVILDMIMPDIDGVETYKRLKEVNPGVKVLFSSGYVQTEKFNEVIGKGINGFIKKPFSMAELKQEINKII